MVVPKKSLKISIGFSSFTYQWAIKDPAARFLIHETIKNIYHFCSFSSSPFVL